MKVILYDNAGVCAMVFPAYTDPSMYHSDEIAYLIDRHNGESLVKHQITKPFTNDEILQLAIEKAVPPDADYAVVDFADIKNIIDDETYRNALIFSQPAGVAVDMQKAREIHRNNLRTRRKPLLEALDVAFMRATEAQQPDEKAKVAILEKKQFLRDLPAATEIERAKTLDKLRDFDPLADFSLN